MLGLVIHSHVVKNACPLVSTEVTTARKELAGHHATAPAFHPMEILYRKLAQAAKYGFTV